MRRNVLIAHVPQLLGEGLHVPVRPGLHVVVDGEPRRPFSAPAGSPAAAPRLSEPMMFVIDIVAHHGVEALVREVQPMLASPCWNRHRAATPSLAAFFSHMSLVCSRSLRPNSQCPPPGPPATSGPPGWTMARSRSPLPEAALARQNPDGRGQPGGSDPSCRRPQRHTAAGSRRTTGAAPAGIPAAITNTTPSAVIWNTVKDSTASTTDSAKKGAHHIENRV